MISRLQSSCLLSSLIENKMGVAEDRISELPDQILHDQILSRVPTKLAVSTSILSKRWRSLWTGVPALEFSYTGSRSSDSDQATKFMNFVDNVLLQHQISNLRSFKLTCGVACDVSRIRSWIFTVAHLNLHEICLDICNRGESNAIPILIYSCQSLIVLKISYSWGELKPPSLISLPSLTTLELNHVTFKDQGLTLKFFSSLPALKSLVLKGCRFSDHQKLEILAPSLNHLKIVEAYFHPLYPYRLIIKICAPKLDYLCCWTDGIPREIILGDMPVLQEALIATEVFGNIYASDEPDVCRNAHDLLKDLVNVKKLHIAGDILPALPHEDLMSRGPTFTNLTCLRIIRPCYGGDLLSVLRIMPNLEELILEKVYALTEVDLTLRVGEMLPQCLLSGIKKFEINEFNGYPEDFCMVKFLITNVPDLEITDIIEAKSIFSSSAKMVTLRRLSSKPSRPLSLQDLPRECFVDLLLTILLVIHSILQHSEWTPVMMNGIPFTYRRNSPPVFPVMANINSNQQAR